MSETICQIIIYNSDTSALQRIASLFCDPNGNDFKCDEYSVDYASIFENVVIGQITGGTISLNVDNLLEQLRQGNPEWLSLDVDFNQVSETTSLCERNGKKTTKKTLLKNVRSLSKKADLYFAVQNGEASHLAKLLKEDDVDLDIVIDGAPLLLYIIAMGKIGPLKAAVARGADIKAVVERTHWVHIETNRVVTTFEAVEGMTLLSVAIELESTPVVGFLIESGVDVNRADVKGQTPLLIAAEKRGSYKYFDTLVQAGAKIDHEGSQGYTALFLVLANDESSPKKTIEWAEKLIAYGADIAHVSRNKVNALWAALNRDRAVLDYIREKGVETYDVPDGFYDDLTTAQKVWRALGRYDVASVRKYLDPEEFNKDEQRDLLCNVASSGRLDLLKALIDKGIPPYLMRDGYWTAGDHAKDSGHKDIVAYLDEQMADFNEHARQLVERARPLYDRFIGVFSKVEERDDREMSSLDAFRDQPLMERFTNQQLMFWARTAVSPQEDKVKTWVDDDFNVFFVRPNRFTSEFWVVMRVDDEPAIVGFDSKRWWH